MAEDLSVSEPLNGSGRDEQVKPYLESQVRALGAMFAGTETCGRTLSRSYAEAMDELLRSLFESALEPKRRQGVLLAAVGGYGRRLLGWKSDLDVRLVTHSHPERMQALAEAMLYPLWDAGISIGH